MEFHFNDHGFPYSYSFYENEIEALTNNNFISLRELFHKIKNVIDYYEELIINYAIYQNKEISKKKYLGIVKKLQKKYFKKEIDYGISRIWGL